MQASNEKEEVDVVDAPLTYSMLLGWRPSLNFYDHGIDVLRALESAKLLTQFRVDRGEVGGRLAGREVLELTSRGLTVSSSRGPVDGGVLETVFGAVEIHIAPRPVHAMIHLQHIVEIPGAGSYEETCAAATRRLWGDVVVDLAAEDFAMMLDGQTRDGLSWQAEFGVIREQDAESRLSRKYSRVAATATPSVAVDGREYPEYGLFVDSTWTPSAPLPRSALSAWAQRTSAEALKQADSLVEKIHRRLGTNSGEGTP